MSARPVRSLITIGMDGLVVVAVFLTAMIVVRFFGVLAAQSWGKVVVTLGHFVTIPLGIVPIKTPYGGVFDVHAAITVAIMLLGEWILSVLRARA